MFGLSDTKDPLSQIYRFKTDKMAYDILNNQPSIMHEYALLHQMLMFSEDFPDDLRFAVIMSQGSQDEDINKIIYFLQFVTSKTTTREISVVKPKEAPEDKTPGDNEGLILMDNKHRRLIVIANDQLEIAKNPTKLEAGPLQIDTSEKAA